ncbi:uncharacterized protein LOC127874473 [Dreissena polymorpha]|uniref:Mab-21-like nucleotidyltransferase domain-containing protein n=1 Tax=Dreissena polymorpha TaxID=45954 RepID=A0A9D4R1A7_DREPO|nr:uncharacterized protein LOC127874473 [Dreissena polymorpha]KAH3850352.1 hypothetical protein DPMN_092761 [Dreissena polymorpha]
MAEGRIDRTMSDTGRLSIHNSMYSSNSRTSFEGVSVEVSNIMTMLGYGEEIRRRRVQKYRELDMRWNERMDLFTIITAGSKAEGLTSWVESDYDMLYVPKSTLCVEAGVDLHSIPDYMEVYRMDTDVYPGHCRMLLERTYPQSLLKSALCDDEKGNTLLSSALVLDTLCSALVLDMLSKMKFERVPLERAGPSLPLSVGQDLNFDIVFAIRCQCPGIMQRWTERPRHWPPPDVVQKVVSLGSLVTPVGFKGSANKNLEWRMCFNMGETELVSNLNGPQAKLYVILKMIVKEVLKPTNKEITSYVLKNIIFWQAESNSPAMFQESNLIHMLHDALGTLRTVISSTQLPYYMIPERNLMAACGLKDEQQRKWVADITNMMAEGPKVMLRLSKIRNAIICHQEPLLWFSRRKIELEMLMLEYNRIMPRDYEHRQYDNAYIIEQEIRRHMNELLREVHMRMLMEGGYVNDPMDIWRRVLM